MPKADQVENYITNSSKPLVNQNVNAFIEAQGILHNHAYVDSYNDYQANIIVNDAYGKKIVYEFDYINNRVLSASRIVANNTNSSRMVKKANSTIIGDTSNAYTYDAEGRLISVKRPNSLMDMKYTSTGNLASQSVNGKEIISSVDDAKENIVNKTYANGLIVDKTYENNKISTIRENGLIVGKYLYDEEGTLTTYQDLKSNLIYNYKYDNNKLVSTAINNGLIANYLYDNNNEAIVSREYKIKDNVITTSQNENGVKSNKFNLEVKKDISNRPLDVNFSINSFNYNEKYKYVVKEPTYEELTENNFEEKLDNKTNDLKVDSYSNNFRTIYYKYDEAGNIISEVNNGQKSDYLYNDNGELIQFINNEINDRYTYDSNGNIVSINNKRLNYDSSSGFDLLTNYSNYSFSYDSIGNPTIYKNHKLTWSGKTLVNFDDVSYTYNPSGIRTSKKLKNDSTTYYTLEGDKVILETNDKNNDFILYYYDANEVLGLNYKGNDYFYEKNPQNDILGIFDSDGNKVVSYEYGPWGQILNISGPLASTLGVDNPYRFKSYRYDQETQLYYLNSRYYDPEIGRFISADNLVNLQYTILNDNYSKNLYMYAFNNPINKYDPNGNMAVGVLNALKMLYSDLKLVPDYAISTPCLVFNANNIYKGFHETAQLVAAKQLSKKGYQTELEYKVSGNSRADILAYKGKNYLYEVKPSTTSNATAYNQLKGYLNKTGFSYGPSFSTLQFDFLPNGITMKVYYESRGIVKYSFYKDKWQWFNKWAKVEILEQDLINKLKIGFWVGVAIAGTIIVATVIEDVLTAGVGIADDAASIGVASGAFRGAVAFGLLFL